MLRQPLLRTPISSKLFTCSALPPTYSPYRNTAISSVFQFNRQASKRSAGVVKPVTYAPKAPPIVQLKREPPTLSSDERFRRFDHEISKNEGPTVLFQAPPQRSYILSAYSTAAFCYVYAGYNFYTTSVNPIIDLGTYQQLLFGGICVVMSAIGTVFLRRGFGLISSITATRSNNKTQIVTKVRRMVPFRKQREIVTTPGQISLSRSLSLPASERSERGAMEAYTRKEKQKAIDNISFFRNPFKKISLALWRIFMNSRRLFTQEYIVYVKIDGQNDSLRLDSLGDVSPAFFALQKAVKSDV